MVIPLWAIGIGLILVAVVVWKLIKFALKILIAVVVFFALLVGLDVLGVFDMLTGLLSSFM